MIRDFSDDAMWKLINLIDEISDEKWCDMTDTIGDALYIGLDIKDYIDNVETYHKKILDKNDISRSDIEKIFSDVEEVAMHYKAIFREAAETIQQQAEYVKKLAFVMDGNIVLKDINSSMKEVLLNMENSQIEFYMAQMRRGEDTGEYDWEYITELFRSNPEDISPMVYGAMIRIFNEMAVSEQEKFIERAYIAHESLEEIHPYYYYTDAPVLRREMSLSPVFINMVDVYRLAVSAKTDEINGVLSTTLGDFNLLSAVRIHASTIYIRGFETGNEEVNITLSKGSDFSINDYVIIYEGLTTKELRNEYNNTIPSEKLIINVYAMRENEQFMMMLDDHAINISEEMRVDNKTEFWKTFANNVCDILLPEEELLGVAKSIISYGTTINNGIVTNQNVDDIQAVLGDKTSYYALGVNASFSTCGNNYAIHTYSLTEGTIEENLREYNEWAMEQANYQVVEKSAYEVCQLFLQGNLEEVDGFDDFLRWVTNKSIPVESIDCEKIDAVDYY